MKQDKLNFLRSQTVGPIKNRFRHAHLHPSQIQLGNIPFQFAFRAPENTASGTRLYRYYRCCSYEYSKANSNTAAMAVGEEEGEEEDDDEEWMGHGDNIAAPPGRPACCAQLVFYTEPGQPDRWLLNDRLSVLQHSKECRGTYMTIQSQRKKDGRAPLLFRANITLLVRHDVRGWVWAECRGCVFSCLFSLPDHIIHPPTSTHQQTPQLQRLLRKQVQESNKRIGPTALHRQVVNDFGIDCSLSLVKKVVTELEASSEHLLLQGFQTLPAVLDFLRNTMGAYTAVETEPPDEHGRRRFLRAIISLKESRVRAVGMSDRCC